MCWEMAVLLTIYNIATVEDCGGYKVHTFKMHFIGNAKTTSEQH